jgi:5-(carboxyamino)imidazole ribonucleotide synthase
MKTIDLNDLELGILGGGQLGKMLIQAASPWHITTHVLDPTPGCPASAISNFVTTGSFRNFEDVISFGENLEHLTIEIEDVNVEALEWLKNKGKTINPAPSILKIIQDKGLQKLFYTQHKIPTSGFELFDSVESIIKAVREKKIHLPFVQKIRKSGYDGRGVVIIQTETDLDKLMNVPSIVEEKVEIQKELSVIVARDINGNVVSYPSVEMVFNLKANLVDHLICPANISDEDERKAEVLAIHVIKAFELVGVLAVELFVDKKGNILVNEVAPRPHNSGHHTIENSVTSQYEQHLRAISGLPLGSAKMLSPAVMVNLLGSEGFEGPAKYTGFEECLAMEGVYIHLYGKEITKPFRKMGHVTILDSKIENALHKAKIVQQTLKVIS